MKKKYFVISFLLLFSLTSSAQFGKLKNLGGGKKDTATKTVDTTKKAKEKSGGSFFSKAVIKLAKASSGLVAGATGMMVKTDDLGSVVPMVAASSNLYPTALGTVDMSFFNGWISNGSLYTVFFSQKNKSGWAKIDGDVTVNGTPADYVSTGIYIAFNKDNTKPANIEVNTKTGQKTAFTIEPSRYPFKIKAINGQKGENLNLDLTKDVVVELEHAPGSEHMQLHAKIAISILGLKTFYDLGYFKGGNKITIPAAAFRNVNIGPGSTPMLSYKNSYLSIDRIESKTTTNASGIYQPISYVSITQDGRFIDVIKEPELNKGLTFKGTEKLENGDIDYNFYKAHAFASRPFEHIKKLGVMSFSIRGTTYVEGRDSKSSSSYSVGGTTYTTTTTTHTWAQFPNVSDEVWAEALASLYTDFTDVAQQELKAPLLPIEEIAATPAYQHISAFSKDDATTSVSFSHSYKNSKLISAYLPFSEGFGENSAAAKIIKESGANALMKFTFDLQIAIEKGKPVMVPKLAFELIGEKNGQFYSTKYCSATISGKGVRYPKNITAADIKDIVRQSDLLTVFRKGLQGIKTSEFQNGDYKLLWDLQ